MRQVRQIKKSNAIMKFEKIMSSMCTRVMQIGAISALADVEKPIFNKEYENILDQLTSYY